MPASLHFLSNSIPAAALVCLAVAGFGVRDAEAAELFDETQATTLFAFDDVSIPSSQNLRLEMRSPERFAGNPVVPRGESGKCDSWAVQFYGSVIRIDGKYRMWYCAVGDEKRDATGSTSKYWRPAYAESDDGIHWNKPNLGLVEYGGNKDNNLVEVDIAPLGILNLKVLYEPEDQPDRRYKMSAHVWYPKNETRRHGSLAVLFSPDGLRWKSAVPAKPIDGELTADDLVLPAIHFEPCGGLYKWDGLYYASGQNCIAAAKPYHGRVVRQYHSGDFINWSQTSAVGFVRDVQHTLLGAGRSREGEQTHEGVSVWNRNNMLIGVYGIWHGAKEWKDVTIDLGLLVSNDGNSFREPVKEWTFLKRGEDGAWDQGGLLQGQGFENVGEQTFVYYGAWDPRNWQGSPPRGGVGIAALPRDRFGDLVVDLTVKGKGEYQMPEITSEFITAPVKTNAKGPTEFFVNADGLGDDAALKVELLGVNAQPLAGYSGQDAAIVRQSGFQTPITFAGGGKELPERIRFKVAFEGKQNTDIRFSALYVK